MKKDKNKYYSLKRILSKNCLYNLIFGERSNGKSYAVLMYILEDYVNSNFKNEGAIIRRYDEDIKPKYALEFFKAIVANGEIHKITKGKYNAVTYNARKFYLKYIDNENPDNNYVDEKPFATCFALTNEEHYKSNAYPAIKTILFDEFITRKYYLVNEFIAFQNVLSTIIRDRDDVKIFMCGNTINIINPYFSEMGLDHVRMMKEGDIDIYDYGENKNVVAVEYTESMTTKNVNKKSNKYFAFNNPRLKMITQGKWELDLYPHLPYKYNYPQNVLYQYFIKYDKWILQCEIVKTKDENNKKVIFTYIHEKTTPIHKDERGMIYQDDSNAHNNYRKYLTKPTNDLERYIVSFFAKDKIFYSTNQVGEIMRNYLQYCNH